MEAQVTAGRFVVYGADCSGWSWTEGEPCSFAEARTIRQALSRAFPHRVYTIHSEEYPEAGALNEEEDDG
jgi:hypothetical protein